MSVLRSLNCGKRKVELNGIRVHTGNENPSDDEFYDNTDTETEETSDGE